MLASLAHLVDICECLVVTAHTADGTKGPCTRGNARRGAEPSVLVCPGIRNVISDGARGPCAARALSHLGPGDAQGGSPWRKCRPEGSFPSVPASKHSPET